MVEWREINYRRIGLQTAFWSVMFVLLIMILSNFVNLSNTNQLSAYDDDWNDMSAFRQDIKDMGIETRSLVSSPLLLSDIEDPRNTTYIVAGVERDTLSLPQFDEDGFITIASEDGYSPSEIDAIELQENKPHIVVGCPGRVFDMLRRKKLSTKYLNLIVLDEADEMLSTGFKEQVYNIFEYLWFPIFTQYENYENKLVY